MSFKRTIQKWLGVSLSFAIAVSFCSVGQTVADETIKIAQIKHEGDVDFQKEVLPILQKNCLACHNAKDAESDLVLETPASILKGGSEGPSVTPGDPKKSLLLTVSTHENEPIMPPEDNDVGAKNLTPQELGLIELWIKQGAKGTAVAKKILKMEKLPAGVNPIYSLSMSPNGQYVAAGRANQIFIYHVGAKREVGRLTDPELIKKGIYQNPGVAHLDLVQSLAFSPDNSTLASGGFKTVKLWKKSVSVARTKEIALPAEPSNIAISADKTFASVGFADGKICIANLLTGQIVKTLNGHTGAIGSTYFSKDGSKLVSGSADKSVRVWDLKTGVVLGMPVISPFPVSSVIFLKADQQVAFAGDEKSILVYETQKIIEQKPAPKKEAEPKEEQKATPKDAKPQDDKKEDAAKQKKPAEKPQEKPPEPIKPIRTINGHSNHIVQLTKLKDDVTLVSASKDGTVRFWNSQGGNQLKQIAHGEPLSKMAIRADEKRLATSGTGAVVKLWRLDNNQMVAQIKGEPRAQKGVEMATLHVGLRKKYVDFANKDVADHKKRIESEKKNQTKAETDLKNATAAQKTKQDAFAKADKASKDAQAAVAKATTEIAKFQKLVADTTAKTVSLDAQLKKLSQEIAAHTKTMAATQNSLKQAAAKKQKANQDAAAKPEDENLKKGAETAAAEVAKLENQIKAETATKQTQETMKAELTKQRQQNETTKGQHAANLKKQQTAKTQADNKLKATVAPLKKATDELTAAKRTTETATRGLERAKKTVATVNGELPGYEAAVKANQQKKVDADNALKAAQAKSKESEKPAKSVAFDPVTNDLVISGSTGNTTSWESETGQPVETFDTFAPNDILVGNGNNLISLLKPEKKVAINNFQLQWNLVRQIGTMESDHFIDRVTALAFNSDGTQLAVGGGEPSRGGQVSTFEVATGKQIQSINEPHSDTVLGLSFSPDSTKLARCGTDRFMKTFNLADGKLIRAFEGHTHHVMGCSWSADGRLLASSGADKVIKIWDVQTGEQKRTISGFGKEVTSVKFVENRQQVIASSGDASIRLNEAISNRQIRRFSGYNDFVYCVDASRNGKLIVAGGHDSVIRIWNENGQIFTQFAAPTTK